ncbi:MAG: hypothetical protein RJA76_143 [Bacteroidota bacterium]|jgi:putative transcriptional regulator
MPLYHSHDLKAGTLLIAEPYLGDASFHRKVILLCEHTNAHSFGLVLNQKHDTVLDSILDGQSIEEIPLFSGGPVDPSIMQFLHRRPDLIPGGVEIANDLFWAGDFDKAIEAIVNHQISFEDIKFFIGYSGWDAGQLDRELTNNSWHLAKASSNYVFDTAYENLWRKVLYDKGGDYRVLSTYPEDPSWN